MKITIEQEKPVFKPITITLETAQEYFELLAVLRETPVLSVKQGLEEMGLIHLFDYVNKPIHFELHHELKEIFNKVKETL